MKLYLNRKELPQNHIEFWKDVALAFPDWNCECVQGDFWPVKCSKCGADRTDKNWSRYKHGRL